MRKTVGGFMVFVLVFSFFSVSSFAATSEDAPADNGIFGGLSDVLSFVKDIFIPKPDYFHNKITALNDKINDKLGGVAYLYNMIKEFLSDLSRGASAADLTFSVPKNFLYSGYGGFSIDFLQSSKPYIKLLNDVLTAAFCIFTGIMCYHKLRTIFAE